MKHLVIIVLLSAISWAQAPPRRKPPVRSDAPVIATEGIDISTERHHKLVFENEKVRVFAVELPGQAATGLLRHDHDFLMLALSDSQAEIAPERGRAQQVRMGAGELQLGTAGLVNRVMNKAGTPMRYLIIQILAGIEPKLAICGLSGPACVSDLGDLRGPNATVSGLFETPTVKLTRIELDPGAMLEHRDKYPRLLVALSDVNLGGQEAEKGIQLAPGEVNWLPNGFTHPLTNIGQAPARALSLEIK